MSADEGEACDRRWILGGQLAQSLEPVADAEIEAGADVQSSRSGAIAQLLDVVRGQPRRLFDDAGYVRGDQQPPERGHVRMGSECKGEIRLLVEQVFGRREAWHTKLSTDMLGD
jgi:hypothetical protein